MEFIGGACVVVKEEKADETEPSNELVHVKQEEEEMIVPDEGGACVFIKEERADETVPSIPFISVNEEKNTDIYHDELGHVKKEEEMIVPVEEIMVRIRGDAKQGPQESAVQDEPAPKTLRNPEDLPKVYMEEELLALLAKEEEDQPEEFIDDEEEVIESENFIIRGGDDKSDSEEDPEPALPSVSTALGPSQVDTSVPSTSRQWTRQPPTSKQDIPFALNPGLTVDITELTSPRDFFDLILTDELYELVVTQTNLYAQFLKSKATEPNALVKNWSPLTVEEFKHFLGLLFHMGTIPLSRLSDYWSTDPILFNIPSFRRVMSRDRFFAILQALHFAKNPDPSEPTPTDTQYQIRPMIDIFHRNMDTVLTPTKNLTIDKSMVLWSIKLYMLCESTGLVLRFIAYMGSSDKDVGGKDHASKVVNKLMEGKLDVGHSLFIDNFYNSVELVHELLSRGTYVTGTLRKNRRSNPAEVIRSTPKKGEVLDFYSDEGVCVFKWRDKRDVLMISSEFSGTMVDVTTRRGVIVQKPEMVVKYNESMGGVDHYDQIMAYYPIQRKSLKWSKKLGIHILHLSLYNAFTLYNKHKSKITLYDFRNYIIKSLLPPVTQSPSGSRPLKRTGNKGLSNHYPTSYDVVEGKKKKKRKRCLVCLRNKERRETTFYCPACPGFPPLCVENCFLYFHKDMVL